MKKGDDDLKKLIENLIDMLEDFNNKHRREILRLTYKNPMTISELKRKLNSSDKVTWHNVRRLKEAGIIDLKKMKHKKSQPVYVTSYSKPEEFLMIFQDFLDDIKKEAKKKK